MPTDLTATDVDVAGMVQAVRRITEAWASNDADAFADVFTTDGIMILPGGVFLTSREEIRSFMRAAYAGDYRGTGVFGEPIAVRSLGADAGVVITKGGVLAPGETEVSPDHTIRATWVLAEQDGEWQIASYQNSPISTA